MRTLERVRGVALAVAALAVGAVLLSDPPEADPPAGQRVPAAYEELFVRAAARYEGVSASSLAAQARVESGFDPRAESPDGAVGLMQFLPSTWSEYGVDGDGDGDADPRSPADAVPSAARYRQVLQEQVGALPGDDERDVLAAYNAGPGAVLRARGVPRYAETRDYVDLVQSWSRRYAYLDDRVPDEDDA